MPFDPADPRSALVTASPVAGVPRVAQYVEFGSTAPDEVSPLGSCTWWVRSQAAVLAYSQVRPGDTLSLTTGAESAVLVPYTMTATLSADGHTADVTEPTVSFVPAGRNAVKAHSEGIIVRVFAAAAEPGLAARCRNADAYADTDDVNVATFAPWPAGDGSLRTYRFADVPKEAGRFGRIYRCSTVMINVLERDPGARDPHKLSPHHHDDFEQLSLQLEGDYIHHMRAPWTPDSATWHEDQHQHCTSPALAIIPPPMIHTSQGVGDMGHWLIDIFAPPRADFSQRPGWILNADHYPLPTT
jgi:hypothetical protein